jgi:hypothetical protein
MEGMHEKFYESCMGVIEYYSENARAMVKGMMEKEGPGKRNCN